MTRHFWRFTILLALSGCASQLGTFYNRPVVEDNIADKISTISLSADRRTVLVITDKNSAQNGLFCEEPPHDTASGIKADLNSTLKNQQVELNLTDAFSSTVTTLAARNAPLDAFRTGVFTLCQFYVNGAVDRKDVSALFVRLIESFERTQIQNPPTAAPKQ